MKKRFHAMLPALACGAAVLAAGSASAITSTFDTDLEGWQAVGFNIDTSAGAVFAGTVLTEVVNAADIVHDSGGDLDPLLDGNPGGFARFIDATEEPGSLLKAPAAFLGDLSGFKGGTFSYDHRLFNEGVNPTSIRPYFILLVSGNPNDLNAYGAILPGPSIGDADTDWVNVSATINETDFLPVTDIPLSVFDPAETGTANTRSGGLLQTGQTLDQVLSNVTSIYISFELVDNNSSQVSEVAGVDNVNLLAIPEPSSLALFGIGVCLIAGRRRRG